MPRLIETLPSAHPYCPGLSPDAGFELFTDGHVSGTPNIQYLSAMACTQHGLGYLAK